jgi:hypothetical protein
MSSTRRTPGAARSVASSPGLTTVRAPPPAVSAVCDAGPPDVARVRPTRCDTRVSTGRFASHPPYPQDAQTAVEMLIIQRSQIAGFSVRSPLAGWPKRPYIPSCAEHGAGVGRSSTGRLYGTARKGRNGKPVGVVDETATGSANFFGPFAPAALARLRSPRCRFPLVLHARRASTRA